MAWTTPKTDFANGDVLTAAEMNAVGTDLQYLYDNDPNAVITTKGDMIGGNASGDAARLAVGSNDQVLVADSSASTGLAWKSYGAQFVAGKNKILNGNFGIWQRGTSFNAAGYTADRWNVTPVNTGTYSVTRQAFTPGAAPVAGYEGAYFLRLAQTTTGTDYFQVNQPVEDVRTFAGQTVTLSFWARLASGTFSSATFVRPTQVFGSGGSANNTLSNYVFTLTSSWQRFSAQWTIPSISGMTIGTGSYLDIEWIVPSSTTFAMDLWGVQLEAGSVATPFTTATGNPASELAACQRYYWRSTTAATYATYGLGMANNATICSVGIQLPVEMRVPPTSVDYSTLQVNDTVTPYAVTSVAFTSGNVTAKNYVSIDAFVASGLTLYRPYFLRNANNVSGYIGFSAEL